MKRDSLFYTFFSRSPTSIFDLISDPPPHAEGYRFDSVSVKEAKFEMDGVFLPSVNTSGPVYFCEVQMQKVGNLYERLFAESFLYFYQNRARFEDWQVVVIYPSRSTEQDNVYPFRAILSSPQMHVVYLDELGAVQDLPLWIGLMVLTVVEGEKAVADARSLLKRAEQEKSADESRVIIELIATVISYKFEQLSKKEIYKMLDISVKETRLYREIRQEERQEGQVQLILRQLGKLFGQLPEDVTAEIGKLTESDVEKLGEAVLDFSNLADVQSWLAERDGETTSGNRT